MDKSQTINKNKNMKSDKQYYDGIEKVNDIKKSQIYTGNQQLLDNYLNNLLNIIIDVPEEVEANYIQHHKHIVDDYDHDSVNNDENHYHQDDQHHQQQHRRADSDITANSSLQENKQKSILLETRLDADDGLYKNYIRYIQMSALHKFIDENEDETENDHNKDGDYVNNNNSNYESDNKSNRKRNNQILQNSSREKKTDLKWLYWCIRRHLVWYGGIHYNSNSNTKADYDDIYNYDNIDYHNYDNDFGKITINQHSHFCVTPGITIGIYNKKNNDGSHKYTFNEKTEQQQQNRQHSRNGNDYINNGKKKNQIQNTIQVPLYSHDLIYKSISKLPTNENCGYYDKQPSIHCLQFVDPTSITSSHTTNNSDIELFPFPAIRSRTPTSAGMMDVMLPPLSWSNETTALANTTHITMTNTDTNKNGHEDSENIKKKKLQEQKEQTKVTQFVFWDILYQQFNISKKYIQQAHYYIQQHLLEIAKDNLTGQCTTDHSCKDKTKRILLKIVETMSSHGNTTNTY